MTREVIDSVGGDEGWRFPSQDRSDCLRWSLVAGKARGGRPDVGKNQWFVHENVPAELIIRGLFVDVRRWLWEMVPLRVGRCEGFQLLDLAKMVP